MRYGFVIDQRSCIGCHACTVACKEEHDVPLGAFRTWVKYVERGTFPQTRRFFSVLRCNHCDNAPCITICPTQALFRRSDGIVDFDSSRCIGCKSCLQACPYDALYIDPNSNTAAKCNYCAHRVEVGLEPACVIVCPEQAIVAGDLDDSSSRIAQLVAREQVQVRKPELGTEPKVFYLGADAGALAPSLQSPPEGYLWAEVPHDPALWSFPEERTRPGVARPPGATRPVYDIPHTAFPWGWRVAAYLWTKSIAAGVLLIAGLATLIAGPDALGEVGRVTAPGLALLFLAITTVLLVIDLKRPERFLYILFKPNWRSWLVWGSWILIAYGGVAFLWFLAGVTRHGLFIRTLAGPAALLGAATAGYSAFLFAQAEGRALWRSPLVLPHLLASCAVAGAATLSVARALVGRSASHPFLDVTLLAGLTLTAFLLAVELGGTHANVDGARAAALIRRGPWQRPFWIGVVGAGLAAPVYLILSSAGESHRVLASLLALTGIAVYESIWLKAGQAVPLS